MQFEHVKPSIFLNSFANPAVRTSSSVRLSQNMESASLPLEATLWSKIGLHVTHPECALHVLMGHHVPRLSVVMN